MTSILEQHEQASQVSQPKPVAEAMTSSGYINIQHEENTPMFSKQKMKFNPSDIITHVAVSNDFLVLAMANGKLFRMDLKNPENSEELNFSKSVQLSSKLSGIFLDPLGNHLIMAFSSKTKDGNPEMLYLHRKSSKLKLDTKYRNYMITEVAWNYENTSEITTGPILLGTSQGHIIETEMEAENDKLFSGRQQTWRQVFDIGKGDATPVTGIQFYRQKSTTKYIIFVTTPTRLYHFIGNAQFSDSKPLLQSIFHQYLTTPETGFQDIPSTLKYSKLQFYHDKNNIPKTFAWLTEPGIFFGQLDLSSHQNSNSLISQSELINYPSEESEKQVPLSMALTEFHILFMYPDHIKAVCLLNHELVHVNKFTEAQGKLKNIVRDQISNTIWAVTEKSVFRYKVIKEDRNVWRIYADKGKFDLAKEYCQNNPAYIDIINVKLAELLFSKGEYEHSAQTYADTQSSFETICLKFLEKDQVNALKVYLSKRLEALADDDKTLTSMIVIWMTELYVSQLSTLRRTGKEDTEMYNQLQSDFEVFLLHPKVSKCMQHIKTVIYDILASHGDMTNLIKLNVINEDYENVVTQKIYTQSYSEVLKTLQNLKKPELFYRFAPDLFSAAPKETVDVLIFQGPKLSPSKLLPAFLSCENDKEHVTETIRYLEFMVQKFSVKERAIHNYLLTLYAENDTGRLMEYLTRQGQDMALVNYDVHYALRLCSEKKITEACVKLSALLGLWQTAVELALDVDLSLAKSLANMPDDDQDLQKQLWLTIAEHVISKKHNVQEAMSFLGECSLLKIEDILPFFKDIDSIDHFRDPICQSLQEYNNQIEYLKAEMEEAEKSAENVRSEIQSFRNCSVLVSASDACSLCEIALLLRPFYLFPCGHRFHGDCLVAEITPSLSPARRLKLLELQQSLSSAELATVTSSGLPLREALRTEIDDIIAGECVYCGEHMIQFIDKPFISDQDWDAVMREWE